MSAIFTLTMNPAVDVTTVVSRIEPLHKLRCEPEQRTAGGGGINVARAIHRLGGKATAVFPSGGSVGQNLVRLVGESGVAHVTVPIAGETREDFSVTESSTAKQYRFIMPGPFLTPSETLACIDALLSRTRPGDFAVASGSLPRGVSAGLYREIADACIQAGTRLIVDTNAPTLKTSIGPGVYLIKPSFSEFVELTGASPLDERVAVAAIRKLIGEGLATHVALTLGDRGAWFVGPDFAHAAAAPPVTPLSTIGAGDSFLAGLVSALAHSAPPGEALRAAVAAGTAALLSPGVELCRGDDVERLIPMVALRDLSP